MSEETTVQETNEEQPIEQPADQTETTPQQEASPEDDAAFEAGFTTVQTGEEPKPEPEPELTPAQIREAIERINDLAKLAPEVERLKGQESKLFGTLGDLKSRVEKAAQPGQPVKLTAEKFERLSKEYPELAEAIAEDLSKVQMPSGQSFTPDEVERVVQERATAIERKFEMKLLTQQHPDWRDQVKSDDFRDYLLTQRTEQDREEFGNSWESETVGKYLSDFKTWKAKATQDATKRETRVTRAITPRGVAAPAAPTVSDDAAFEAGFKSVRGSG